MPDAQYDFGAVDAIDAESIGTPGKRTFRVRVLRGEDTASLWMEKQQLAGLGEAIPRLLEQLDTPDQHANEQADAVSYFPETPTVEFKVGRLALGYSAQEDRLVLIAHALEAEAEEDDNDDNDDDDTSSPTFTCRFTREQARLLSNSCADAVAGGRPICPLCHRPIDPEGHLCPRANGHQRLPRAGGAPG